jgi:hypothetical protein
MFSIDQAIEWLRSMFASGLPGLHAAGGESETSLRSPAMRVIGDLLREARFADPYALARDLIHVVDAIPGYTEEGVALYPELLVTTSVIELLKPFPVKNLVEIGSAPRKDALASVLKTCAPLARGGWTIYVELGDSTVYGVLWVESTELSPTLYAQVVGELYAEQELPVVYLRAVGPRKIEVRTPRRRQLLSFNLDEPSDVADHYDVLAALAVRDIALNRKKIAQAFVRKLIEGALRESHGCLLAVVDGAPNSVAALQKAIPDGKYLKSPIDLMKVLEDSDAYRNREASTAVRATVELVRGMIAQDGITVFTTSGCVLGFNVFVRNTPTASPVGGARRRAFESLSQSGLVCCCLSLSHDGAVSYTETLR